MFKQEILKRVEEREFEKRCIKVLICPNCGNDLIIGFDGSSYLKCEDCENIYTQQ